MEKYQRIIKNKKGESIVVDVYDVLEAFSVTCPAVQHATKKLLAPGKRGAKTEYQDIDEAKGALVRALQLCEGRSIAPPIPVTPTPSMEDPSVLTVDELDEIMKRVLPGRQVKLRKVTGYKWRCDTIGSPAYAIGTTPEEAANNLKELLCSTI